MRLFSILGKGIQTIVDETSKPKSVRTGEAFEAYTRDWLFPHDQYQCLEKTHQYDTNAKNFVQSSLHPDYKFLDKNNRKEFWLEVKFRSDVYAGKINWCTDLS